LTFKLKIGTPVTPQTHNNTNSFQLPLFTCLRRPQRCSQYLFILQCFYTRTGTQL